MQYRNLWTAIEKLLTVYLELEIHMNNHVYSTLNSDHLRFRSFQIGKFIFFSWSSELHQTFLQLFWMT